MSGWLWHWLIDWAVDWLIDWRAQNENLNLSNSTVENHESATEVIQKQDDEWLAAGQSKLSAILCAVRLHCRTARSWVGQSASVQHYWWASTICQYHNVAHAWQTWSSIPLLKSKTTNYKQGPGQQLRAFGGEHSSASCVPGSSQRWAQDDDWRQWSGARSAEDEEEADRTTHAVDLSDHCETLPPRDPDHSHGDHLTGLTCWSLSDLNLQTLNYCYCSVFSIIQQKSRLRIILIGLKI